MKTPLAFVVLVAALLVSDTAMNQEFTVAENLRHQQVLLPPSAPDRSRMAVMDSVMFLEEGGGAGILIYYDDLRTKWDVDYIEFYDIDGNLLLVSWIDRFGVCQVAMDRGLLEPADPSVDGVLVTIQVGTTLWQ
ncbi:MAG TPA: hypothetical protein VGW77_12050 [Candidatus Binatia bacterium]|nr:hypothetical protein [Candidatus Binatia bacterium]